MVQDSLGSLPEVDFLGILGLAVNPDFHRLRGIQGSVLRADIQGFPVLDTADSRLEVGTQGSAGNQGFPGTAEGME